MAAYKLLRTTYPEPRQERQIEYETALVHNRSANVFDEIFTVSETPIFDPPGMHVPARPTYDMLFAIANDRWPKGTRVVLANSDIYFDESLRKLDAYNLHKTFLCLSRWNIRTGGSPRLASSPLSHDAWIFETPLPPLHCDWFMGILGCDSRVARQARAAGLLTVNPCLSVFAWHLHESAIRNYDPDILTLQGPGVAIPFSTLAEAPLRKL